VLQQSQVDFSLSALGSKKVYQTQITQLLAAAKCQSRATCFLTLSVDAPTAPVKDIPDNYFFLANLVNVRYNFFRIWISSI